MNAGQGDRGDRKPAKARPRKKGLDLFAETRLPEGMKYQPNFLSAEEERALLRNIENLPFKEFEFHGFTGKRRTVSFGWRYDFNGGGLGRTEDMLEFLMKLSTGGGITGMAQALTVLCGLRALEWAGVTETY